MHKKQKCKYGNLKSSIKKNKKKIEKAKKCVDKKMAVHLVADCHSTCVAKLDTKQSLKKIQSHSPKNTKFKK